MRLARNAWPMGWIGSGLLLIMAVTSGTSRSPRGFAWFGPKPPREYATAHVRRTDLKATLVAGGRVDSADRTIIVCELEATMGMSWGSSTILSLVPEGTMVKKGDVLCSLDSSRYEEALRLQEIHVGQVRADFTKAELNLEVAKLSVAEYRDGLMEQSLKELKGRIALTRADYERAVDRLGWTRRMLQKGYLSRALVATEESNVAHIEHNLKRNQTALQMFEVWTAPKDLKILAASVLMAQSINDYETSRLAAAEDRLQFYREQVEACTIKAPHDGFLIYYTYPQLPNYRIKEGTTVLRTQKLFYLPDLDRMEVTATLHETVVKNVHPGMKARILVEGLPGRVIEGHVDSIAALPLQLWYSDVKNFAGTIRLDDVPAGLKPGMTASVELLLQKQDVLVIPSAAIAVEQGQDVCYVAHQGILLRRAVRIGQTTSDLIEITEGLEENDSVALDPSRLSVDIVAGTKTEQDEPAGESR